MLDKFHIELNLKIFTIASNYLTERVRERERESNTAVFEYLWLDTKWYRRNINTLNEIHTHIIADAVIIKGLGPLGTA